MWVKAPQLMSVPKGVGDGGVTSVKLGTIVYMRIHLGPKGTERCRRHCRRQAGRRKYVDQLYRTVQAK